MKAFGVLALALALAPLALALGPPLAEGEREGGWLPGHREGCPCCGKVKVDFYTESLCPGCAYAFEKVLFPAVDALGDLFTVNIVPYGNARTSPEGQVTCQHGPKECELNSLYSCVIFLSGNETMSSPVQDFLRCAEKAVYERSVPDIVAYIEEKCAALTGFGDELDKCAAGPLGEELTKEAAEATPDHRFVPWVVVEGQPLLAKYAELPSVICEIWQRKHPDDDVPAACKSAAVVAAQQGGAAQAEVCSNVWAGGVASA